MGYAIKPNFLEAAKIFLRAFRDGHLGQVLLDQDKIMTVDGEVYPDLTQQAQFNQPYHHYK